MNALERSAGFGGSKGLIAGGTYDTVEDPTLPEVHTIFILTDSGKIGELKDRFGANLLTQYQDVLNGKWNNNLPITALDGQFFSRIVSTDADLALYTVKGKRITV